MFLDVLKHAATEKCQLTRDKPVLVGVSGGADSLALMAGLETLGYPLIIGHLDHGIRPESAGDADFVKKMASARGLAFVSKWIDVQQIAENESQSLEEAARNVRYQFLFSQARKLNAQAVAVGHHADDQVETVLMHFLRGSGPAGLSGMWYRRLLPIWDDQIPLVRPLLGIWREAIEVYLEQVGLVPRLDLSNQETTYFRNRIRHQLLPKLETYNPKIRQVLWQTADVIREEEKFLDMLAETALQECLISQEAEQVEINRPCFLQLTLALQRRIIRLAAAQLKPDLRDVGFDSVERARSLILNTVKNNEIDLVGKLNLVVFKHSFLIKTWAVDLPKWNYPQLAKRNIQACLGGDGTIALQNGWQLSASTIPKVNKEVLEKVKQAEEHEVFLDLDDLTMPLSVRCRKPGDRWQPLGMGGQTKKLKAFFIDLKIPEHLRDLWPLVCSAERIVWVVGLRPSEAFKVTDKTRSLLYLQVHQ